VEHCEPGDVVVAPACGLLAHYADLPAKLVPLPLDEPVGVLDEVCRGPGRTWIVVASSRSGKPDDLQGWLGAHCSQQLEVRKRRFDYFEYAVEVYRYEPRNGAATSP
jgi:hypothetical protein